MEFLREIYALVTPGTTSKKKKKTKGGTLLPLGGWIGGHSHYHDDDKDDDTTSDAGAGGDTGGGEMGESAKLVVPVSKPRNKQLHDVLSSRKGGRMTDKKADYKRSEKHKRKPFFESRWEYEIEYEEKDRSGEGRDRLRHTDGIVNAGSKTEAIAAAKARHKNKTIVGCSVRPHDGSKDE